MTNAAKIDPNAVVEQAVTQGQLTSRNAVAPTATAAVAKISPFRLNRGDLTAAFIGISRAMPVPMPVAEFVRIRIAFTARRAGILANSAAPR